MISFAAFTDPRSIDSPATGLIIHLDDRIPGYSSVMTVPVVFPEEPAPPAEPAPPNHKWLLVVTAHQSRFLAYLKSRGLRFNHYIRRITSAEQLMGIDDAEIVFLGDWTRLPESEAIHWTALYCDATVTFAPND